MWSGSSRLLIRPRFGWSRNVTRTVRRIPATSRLSVFSNHQLPLTTKAEKDHKKADNDSVFSIHQLPLTAKAEKDDKNAIVRGKKDEDEKKQEEKLTKTQKLMKQIKEAGLAGIISYGFWEVAFWSASVPVVIVSYHQLSGHWPDFSDKEEVAKLAAEVFVYVNLSRFTVPLRIGLALSTTPLVQKHIVDRFKSKKDSANKPK